MEAVLVSSCLLGHAVRYDGGDKRCDHEILQRWLREGRVVAVCPEVAVGQAVPRLPAEITGGNGGLSVHAGIGRVVDSSAQDLSAEFIKAAEHALAIARSKGIRIAILKEGSPSCGSRFTYDGTFTHTKIASPGVTAAWLQHAGIEVFSEEQLVEADLRLKQIEAQNGNPV